MPTTGDPTYLAELDRARQLHIDKAAGYTGDNPDAWSNFREAENWGSSALDGCFIRMGDKYKRAQNVYRNASHDRVGESLIDTLRDLAAYAQIAVCLILEQQAKSHPVSKNHPGEFLFEADKPGVTAVTAERNTLSDPQDVDVLNARVLP